MLIKSGLEGLVKENAPCIYFTHCRVLNQCPSTSSCY